MVAELIRKLPVTSAALAVLAAVAFFTSGAGQVSAAPQDEFPTMAGEARRFYEARIDDWMDGPAEALLTLQEREIWETLEATSQRAEFIRWFWERRDPDGRAIGNKFQEEFYENVAYANQRFRSFPRGWKSDRGRVRITLGKPDIVSRQTYQQLGGVGIGPDFEIWSYTNLGSSRAFQSPSGEFVIYFAETRIGHFEVWDFQWGAGIWDRNIRMAFEITVEAAIIDPMTPFEPGRPRGNFVREISEGSLPTEIPTGIWSDLGGGGAVSVPVQIQLGDLLFQPEGDVYVARLEAMLALDPQAGSGATSVTQAWEVRLAESDLLALGDGSFVAAVTAEASPGTHDASLVVAHPLAATDAEWSQAVEVSTNPASAIVVGQAVLQLDAADPAAIGILMSNDGLFAGGGNLAVGIWMRGTEIDPQGLSIQLEAGAGTYALEIDDVRWLGGTAGPLLVKAQIPELEEGMYTLRVDFGAGLEAASTPVEIGG